MTATATASVQGNKSKHTSDEVKMKAIKIISGLDKTKCKFSANFAFDTATYEWTWTNRWEFLPWEIWVAFPKENQLQQSRYLTLTNQSTFCWVFSCFHNPPNS